MPFAHTDYMSSDSVTGVGLRGSIYCRGIFFSDHLCGLVARVLGYRSGGPGTIPGTTSEKKVVGLERCPLSLVSTN
jgi:hypothetical protein